MPTILSTARVQRVTEADVLVSHPEEWTPEQVQTAVHNRRGDVQAHAQFWDADDETTKVVKIAYQVDTTEPDSSDDAAMDAPVDWVELTEDDLAAPAPPPIVTVEVVETPAGGTEA